MCFSRFLCTRVFFIVLDASRVFPRIGSQCVSRFSTRTFLYRLRHLTQFFSSVWRHNACILLVFLHRLRRLTRFPPYCGHNACISHVYLYRLRPPYAFSYVWRHNTVCFSPGSFCTRVFLYRTIIKTPYAFSSVLRHNACVLLAFLHRFRRLTRFPPYWGHNA